LASVGGGRTFSGPRPARLGDAGWLDTEVHEHARSDPRVKVLMGLPGVGEFTVLVILAEVGDISRFPYARKLAAWAGLTPTVRGLDTHVRHGHISKQGSAWLRWIRCEAAQTAKRHPDFAETCRPCRSPAGGLRRRTPGSADTTAP
jgi:hypothetical protein